MIVKKNQFAINSIEKVIYNFSRNAEQTAGS